MTELLEQAVQLFFSDWLAAFFNPQKRVFWGYLISALIISIVWLALYKRINLIKSIKIIFSPIVWLSQSARADYFLMILNGAIMTLLSPLLLAKATVASLLFAWLHEAFNGRALIATNASAELIAIGFTLFLFVFDDFARYWLHRWLHTSSFLWSFHKVHHSATTLNPLTVFRSHPVEAVLFTIRSALVQGISVALFIYFFGSKVTLVTVLTASVFSFVFNLLGSNLRHSPVSISYWKKVESILMSPAQHHIHHSYAPEHIDKNFGVVFSFWDLWFGSHCFSKKNQALSYGLKNTQDTDNTNNYTTNNKQHTLVTLYFHPFIDAWKVATKTFSKSKKTNHLQG